MREPSDPAATDISRSRRRVLSAACSVPVWVFAGLLVWPGRPWRIDLLSHFVPHFAAVLLLLAGLAALSRRARPACIGVALGGVALLGWHVGACRPPSGHARSDGPLLKVVHYNAHAQSSAGDAAFVAWLRAQDADLVCLIETPWSFSAMHPWVRERYPYRVEPTVQLAWPNLLLSKHPIEPLELEAGHPDHVFSFVARRSMVVTLPGGGRVLWTAMHPVSPRTRRSWQKALDETARDAGILARYRGSSGALPILITGDFNSSPTGRLHREFAQRTGLIGWSPVLGAGTWPSLAGRWLGVPIDRVWTSPELRVTRMEVGPRFASDHLAVVAWVWAPAPDGGSRAERVDGVAGNSELRAPDAR